MQLPDLTKLSREQAVAALQVVSTYEERLTAMRTLFLNITAEYHSATVGCIEEMQKEMLEAITRADEGSPRQTH